MARTRARSITPLLAFLAATLLLLEVATVGLVLDRARAAEFGPRGEAARIESVARTAEPRPASPKPRFEPPEPAPSPPVRHPLVEVERPLRLTARPGGGRVVGTMPEGSRYFGTPIVAWVLEVSDDGRYGLVPIPYAGRDATGWMPLRGLDLVSTRVSVVADLSEHRIEVLVGDRVVFRAATATGAPASPTPAGRYFVTDRVRLSGTSMGTFAFGLSGIQPDLPAGWSGGDQLAIHGTNDPSSIGRSASAGCLRVSERTLDRLKPLLRLGTPVIVRP